jgi:hypothetical protein
LTSKALTVVGKSFCRRLESSRIKMHEAVGTLRCSTRVSWDMFFNAGRRARKRLNSRILFTSRAGVPHVGFVLVGYLQANHQLAKNPDL